MQRGGKEMSEEEGYAMKKKIKVLILGCGIFLLTQPVMAQEKCEAPVWKVGDKWTYETSSGTKFTHEVVDVKGENFIIENKTSDTSYILDKKTLNLQFTIDEGKKRKAEDAVRKRLNFPLFVGKKWDDMVDRVTRSFGSRITIMLNYSVEATEDIITPAGTFSAYRIVLKASGINQAERAWAKFWYSPQVKYFVKREVENVLFGGVLGSEGFILVNYELKN
jgi:hypothetical protein